MFVTFLVFLGNHFYWLLKSLSLIPEYLHFTPLYTLLQHISVPVNPHAFPQILPYFAFLSRCPLFKYFPVILLYLKKTKHSQTPLPIKREDRSKKKKSSARVQAPMTVRGMGYLPERRTFISSISPNGRNISYLLHLLLSNHSLLPVVFLNQFPLSKLH